MGPVVDLLADDVALGLGVALVDVVLLGVTLLAVAIGAAVIGSIVFLPHFARLL